jgi:hypothetical protein
LKIVKVQVYRFLYQNQLKKPLKQQQKKQSKKKEIALQVYAQREAIRKEASDWLNSNKVETPKTRLNETEEERKEWERMEREANK